MWECYKWTEYQQRLYTLSHKKSKKMAIPNSHVISIDGEDLAAKQVFIPVVHTDGLLDNVVFVDHIVLYEWVNESMTTY